MRMLPESIMITFTRDITICRRWHVVAVTNRRKTNIFPYISHYACSTEICSVNKETTMMHLLYLYHERRIRPQNTFFCKCYGIG